MPVVDFGLSHVICIECLMFQCAWRQVRFDQSQKQIEIQTEGLGVRSTIHGQSEGDCPSSGCGSTSGAIIGRMAFSLFVVCIVVVLVSFHVRVDALVGTVSLITL